jgi:transposase-like protein
MKITSEFVRRTYYSQELKHQICKDHIDNGLSLRQCVEKYNLSCHSLVHDWLRKLGYIAGYDRRSRSAYLSVENFNTLSKNQKK